MEIKGHFRLNVDSVCLIPTTTPLGGLVELGEQTVTPGMESGNGKYERAHSSENFWDLFHQSSETGFTHSLKKQTRKSSSTQANVSQTRKGPANSTWPAHWGSGLAWPWSQRGKWLFIVRPALFTMEAVDRLPGKRASCGYSGFSRPGRWQAVSGSGHSHGLVPQTCSYFLFVSATSPPHPPLTTGTRPQSV